MPVSAKPAITHSAWLAAELLTRKCPGAQTSDVVRALIWLQLKQLRPNVTLPKDVRSAIMADSLSFEFAPSNSQAEYVLGELHEQLVGGEVAIAEEWLIGLNRSLQIVSANDALLPFRQGNKAWKKYLRRHGVGGSLSTVSSEPEASGFMSQESNLPNEFHSLLPWVRTFGDDNAYWVIAPGQPYWRSTAERARRGVHYTPASLSAHVVEKTLSPLSNLQPTVCDLACGGGVFLVEAGKFLLQNSSQQRKRSDLLRACLFGVDVDPIAVETSRLALWLLANEPDLPLSAFDNNVRQGDALVGLDWQRVFHAVFREGGFDAVVGNPPFLGGRKIRRALGAEYLRQLTTREFPGASGNADLCAFFFRRAAEILRPGGSFGLLATNTIAQGDTRETGLSPLLTSGRITRAETNFPWPGEATLRASAVWFQRHGENDLPQSDRSALLEGVAVPAITSFLTPSLQVSESGDHEKESEPKRLRENTSLSFQGSIVLGMGFVLSPQKAKELLTADVRNQKVIRPYLTGADLSGQENQQARRYVINFFDWPLDRAHAPSDYTGPVAADFPLCHQHITEHVRPQRTRRTAKGEFVLRKPLPQRWWQYADKRPALYNAIAGLRQVICKTRHSPYCAFELVDLPAGGIVFQESLIVFASCDLGLFGLLSSGIHEVWARRFGSTLGVGLRYSSTDCFDTFVIPGDVTSLREPAAKFRSARRQLMKYHQIGLTRAEKLWHSPSKSGSQDYDQKHEELLETVYHSIASLDYVTASAYGWNDLNLKREFQSTADGPRFAFRSEIQMEILQRLLELNAKHASSS